VHGAEFTQLHPTPFIRRAPHYRLRLKLARMPVFGFPVLLLNAYFYISAAVLFRYRQHAGRRRKLLGRSDSCISLAIIFAALLD
jgi:hypothetical protein